MKKIRPLSLGMAALLFASAAFADDDSKAAPEPSSPEPQNEVSSVITGKIVILDPDGKKQEIKISGDKLNVSELLDKVPEKTRGQMELFFKKNIKIDIDDLDFSPSKTNDPKIDAILEKSLKNLPAQIRERVEKSLKESGEPAVTIGRGFAIGPDGKLEEFQFNKSDQSEMLENLPAQVREQVEKALKGSPWPKTSMRRWAKIINGEDPKEMEMDLEIIALDPDAAEDGKIKVIVESVGEEKFIEKQIEASPDTHSELDKKLDAILNRLDQIEKQLAEIQQD